MDNFKEKFDKLNVEKKLLEKENKWDDKKQNKRNKKLYKIIVKKSHKLSKVIANEVQLKVNIHKNPTIINKLKNIFKKNKSHLTNARIEIGKNKFSLNYEYPFSFSPKRKFESYVKVFFEFNKVHDQFVLKINQKTAKYKFENIVEENFIITLDNDLKDQILDSLKVERKIKKAQFEDSNKNLI